MLIASCALAVLGLAGNILLGRKLTSGWVLAIVNQCIFLWMGIVTGGYGLCAVAAVNAVIAARNGLAWRRDNTATAKAGQL